jgi:hypothetical protein
MSKARGICSFFGDKISSRVLKWLVGYRRSLVMPVDILFDRVDALVAKGHLSFRTGRAALTASGS